MIPFFGNEANGDKKKKPATQISAAGYKKAISEFTVSRSHGPPWECISIPIIEKLQTITNRPIAFLT